jgi:Pyruvate/2-oxoacid:ferredoxin oxidoreductase delta subunit
MCEFCKEHGEGKKWYLNVKNYAQDLLSDIKRREFIRHFNREVIEKGQKKISKLERIFAAGKRPPSLNDNLFRRQNKPIHYGQVIPVEDVREIFGIVSSIVRLPCGCRWAASKKEERCCFGISLGPQHWYEESDMDYFGKPDISQFESMDIDRAMKYISKFDRQGLVHSVWTFITPFIGGICNCDFENCLAVRSTFGLGMSMMFRAEYASEINTEVCTGCGKCIEQCPFGTISFSESGNKCFVNKKKCYGCGICRSICDFEAIKLTDRTKDPVTSEIW